MAYDSDVGEVEEVAAGSLDFDFVPPDPAGTIEALSALGYSLEAAIADLVDNSIDAGASQVSVLFHWAGAHSYVAVVDDGVGMSLQQLLDAMAMARRGPRTTRRKGELGRFGMGLKTASFSQASTLTVMGRQDGTDATRSWDLKHVVMTQSWQLLHEPTKTAAQALDRLKPLLGESGAIVVWTNLTKLVDDEALVDDEDAHEHFKHAISAVEQHLAMTFSRFLPSPHSGRQARLSIEINGASIEAWDPFLTWHPYTMARPIENLEVEGHSVVVRPYLLPVKRRLSDEQYRAAGGARGWLEQQGFYVYRNDRLIVAGGWLGLPGFRSDEKHVLARIAVEIPAEVDHLWSVDVKKASASPPNALRGSLQRTAKATRVEAQKVLTSIGRVKAVQKSDELSYVWRPENKNGDFRLKINWGHPLVKEALSSAGDGKKNVRALLRFVEETVPIAAVRTMFDSDTDEYHQPFADAPSNEIIEIARRTYVAYISQGLTPTQAKMRLKNTSPWNEYPDLLKMLELE